MSTLLRQEDIRRPGGDRVIHPPSTVELRMAVRFRKCRRQDLEKLEWGGLFTEHREIIRDAYLRQKAGKNLMLLAEANAQPIGQIWIDFERKASEEVPVLWAFRVCHWFQGRGIGSRLLEWAEHVCAGVGFDEVELGVEFWNVLALQFYKRRGYRVHGHEKETFSYTTPWGRRKRETHDEWILRKCLHRVDGVQTGWGMDSTSSVYTAREWAGEKNIEGKKRQVSRGYCRESKERI